MTLDISTLILLTIAIGFGLGVLSVVFSYLQPGVRGARLWGAAMLAFGAGYALLYAYASTRHVALLYAGWIGVLCAVLMMVRALNRICGIKGPGTVLDLSVVGIALFGWIFFSFTYPSPLGHANTIPILMGIVVARAAWDTWSNVRGSRIAVPAGAVAVLLCVVAATSILDALPPVGGNELPSEFGSPVLVLVWAVSLAFLTVCVLWLEVSQLYATMETAGMVDVVTGLSNRLTIIAEIEGEHSRSHRAKTPFSIAIFGMDNFENVIDEHGQRAGDQMLKWAAGVIRNNVRPYDKVGRYDREEFLLMMPMTTEKESLGIAERARLAIQKQACIVDGRQIGVTVSVGVAVGERGADLDAVLHAADDAISRAKAQGRNCTVVAPLIGMVAEVGIVAEGQGANA
jgi:diguanylate cyclase (GGDEF)-like protein